MPADGGRPARDRDDRDRDDRDRDDRDRDDRDRDDRDRAARSRDRDGLGRPRQSRPRDDLGRPLPYGATGAAPVSDDPLPPEQTIALAAELLAAGRPFAAHETFEVAWRHRPEPERNLWQGLAQVCAGRTHAARGNAVGANRLIDRGAGRLTAYEATGATTYGLDLAAFMEESRAQGPA